MAKFPISPEGIAAFEKLKTDLNNYARDIDDRTSALFETVRANQENLGFLEEPMTAYLRQIKKTEKDYLMGAKHVGFLIDDRIQKILDFLGGDGETSGGGRQRKVFTESRDPGEHHYDQGKRFTLAKNMSVGMGTLSNLYYSGNYGDLMRTGYEVGEQLQIGNNEEFLQALNEDIQMNNSFAEAITEDNLGFLEPYKQAMIRYNPDTARLWNEHNSYENIAALLMIVMATDEGRKELQERLPTCMDWFEKTMENGDNIEKGKGFAKRKVIENG